MTFRASSQTRPFMAFCLAVMMFSLAGIPPMAGFFGKLFVFRAAIDAGLYSLSILRCIGQCCRRLLLSAYCQNYVSRPPPMRLMSRCHASFPFWQA